MAQCCVFRCSVCDNCVAAWDEGNPYYIDLLRMKEKGLPRSRCKVYVYHPSPPYVPDPILLEEIQPDEPIQGNDSPYRCLSCNHEFKVDNAKPRTSCTKCRSTDIVACWLIAGCTCPKCHQGKFELDESSGAIS